MRILILLGLLLAFLSASASPTFNGEVKAQYVYLDYPDSETNIITEHNPLYETLLDFRLRSEYSSANWQTVAHYQLNRISGSQLDALNQLDPALSFSTVSNKQWFDLSHTISHNQDTFTQHQLDRLFIRYSNQHSVIKIGRQALSWGNGLVFHPMDLFNPFSPDARDTSYKPGTDMLYAQWLFDSGADISFLAVPRRDPFTNRLTSSQSSAALKWHHFINDIQLDVLIARDYTDRVFGLGISGPLGEAIWRADIVPVFPDHHGHRTSMIFNLQHAFQWLHKNMTGFVEYYRNGFGIPEDSYTLNDLPAELVERLSRQQVFNSGRDYLSLGAQIEVTALLNIMPTFIFNLNDQSTLSLIQGVYSSSQNTRINFGLSHASGSSGSEYSGLETATASNLYLQTPSQLYLRFNYYF